MIDETVSARPNIWPTTWSWLWASLSSSVVFLLSPIIDTIFAQSAAYTLSVSYIYAQHTSIYAQHTGWVYTYVRSSCMLSLYVCTLSVWYTQCIHMFTSMADRPSVRPSTVLTESVLGFTWMGNPHTLSVHGHIHWVVYDKLSVYTGSPQWLTTLQYDPVLYSLSWSVGSPEWVTLIHWVYMVTYTECTWSHTLSVQGHIRWVYMGTAVSECRSRLTTIAKAGTSFYDATFINYRF
jgi:hypothetical protein